VLVIDKGGCVLAHCDQLQSFDLTTIGALASGAYLANQTIAGLVNEENFSSVYQQGEKFSMLIMNINENSLLVIIFAAELSVGAIKFYAIRAIQRIAAQMKTAWERDPSSGMDLSVLYLENPDVVFRKKA